MVAPGTVVGRIPTARGIREVIEGRIRSMHERDVWVKSGP